MTIYVLYAEYGADEGCSSPEGVTLKLEEAEAWVAKNIEQNAFSEFDLPGQFWHKPA